MPRPPAALSPEIVRRRVLEYVQRHPGTVANARRRFGEKIRQSIQAHGGEAAPLVEALEAALALGLRYGYLDDARYAESRARRGLSRGVAPARVRAGLAAKGVSAELARAGVAAATEGDPLAESCAAYVKRRRLGPWRAPEAREAEARNDLAKLARAGFPYAVAKAALQAPEPEDEPEE